MEALALATVPTSSLRPTRSARTLDHVIADLRAAEAAENPDTVTTLASLTMTPAGTIAVPGAGEVALNTWSRAQLAAIVGLRWNRWFVNASPSQQAEEINRRFARTGGAQVRLRTTRTVAEDVEADGTLRAIVTPSYTPVSDVAVATMLRDALSRMGEGMEIVRSSSTEMTTSYVVQVGEPFVKGGPGAVGEVWGCLAVRNSGVGFAKLSISALLHRIACLNGMVLPVPGSSLFSGRHRGLLTERVGEKLSTGLAGIGERLHRGADVLAESGAFAVSDVEGEVRALLRDAHLPLRLTSSIVTAYAREPHASRFGVSQAVTLAAQDQAAEIRHDLEAAAGRYLTRGGGA